VRALTTRKSSPDQVQRASSLHRDALFRLAWTELGETPSRPPTGNVVVLGDGHVERATQRFTDLSALLASLDRGEGAPDVVLAPFGGTDPQVVLTAHRAAHRATADALALLQAWIADERLASTRLVLLTQRAIATAPDEDVLDLAHAPLWGLVRSAQNEHPDLPIFLVDTDGQDASHKALLAGLDNAGDDRQLALRNGRCLAPRLVRAHSAEALRTPDGSAWRLHIPVKGTFEALRFVENPSALAPLTDGQVRIAVHAAGLNFRDVLDVLGMYPGDAGPLGGEAAGVVTEIGPGVTHVAVGDRVMGLTSGAFAPLSIADARALVRIPAGLSFVEAASIPATFLTAFYALVDLARLQPGERILVHAAAGGVGHAAVQLARHLGADVFGTASPPKWSALRAAGFDDRHLASSRDLAFEAHFLRTTDGRGMDVVLDSLAREFVDASLRLLPHGGRFVEMGKTDIRDPDAVALAHPGVSYRAFDLVEAGLDRIQRMLSELVVLFERGVLSPAPITTWDLRRAPQAMRALGQARHVGKFVFTIPRGLRPHGTVLITGGTGTLGALVAHHLVETHGARHLLLTSRQGPSAPGADALRRELEHAGASVTIAACDVADPQALEALLDAIPDAHPLCAVVHAAGGIDDGLLTAMTPERIARVFAPKLDAAWLLHQLTKDRNLDAFVLFSSLAGVTGSPGQSNYAAANAFLDALAHHRHANGLPAASLAWGYWADKSALTAHLRDTDTSRMKRGGLRPIDSALGLALFDVALRSLEPTFVPAALDLQALARGLTTDLVPPLLRGLVPRRSARPLAARSVEAASLAQRLSSLSPPERERALLDIVSAEIRSVLGLASHAALEPHRSLQELGLDSLMAVELRNRLANAAGLRLKTTLLFDHPTPAALTTFLALELLGGASVAPVRPREKTSGDEPIAIVAMSCRYPGGVRNPEDLWRLVADGKDAISGFPANRGWNLDALDRAGAAREGGLL
jgi:NADPH:quinone reductase-like Zn-dependent oxidoreductase/acyl carrier protein